LDRRAFLSLLGAGLVVGEVRAEKGKSHRVGALNFRSMRPVIMQTVTVALRERGYVEGENLSAEFRFGDPEEFRALAAELVRLDPDLLLCGSSGPLRALMAETRSIPVVAVDLETDPIAAGFAATLARPGSNLTGLFLDLPEFSAKRLELLKEILPGTRRVLALWDPALDRAPVASLERAAAALSLGLLLQPVDDGTALIDAFKAASQAKAGAVMVMQSPRLDALSGEILELGAQHRIPVAALFGHYAAEGALLTYGPDVDAMTSRIGDYVDRILKGSKAGDLPIQRPDRFQLILNTRTAKRLGITIPQSVLVRADIVIQ